ncbi:TorF family putative porin [Parabacteroides sp. Marseille-P3160]|uniref:TorF family putative porin n=1 Tax=Parabacteroides sp. Marseille-P3160 TaxID=1917887 RepID=UPI0009BABF79|nr:TorF family putative porin [Parabacteroides sp. Marseille-P3160]
MKKVSKRALLGTMVSLMFSNLIFAQEEEANEGISLTPSADIVSGYVWRGVHQTGASIQPGLDISWKGISLSAWGSTTLMSLTNTSDFSTLPKEFDVTLGYTASGLKLAVTDYWWSGEGAPYGHYKKSHFLEGTIGYSFGESLPLTLTWNTMFGMDGDKDDNGDRNYSTFVEAAYDFSVKGINVTASAGVSPWTGLYHKAGTDGFVLSMLSIKASKSIQLTDSFALPVFTQVIVAPNQDNVYFVFGISL